MRALGVRKDQDSVLDMIARGALRMLPLDAGDVPRIRHLMRKYESQPMDLADASLVRVAEREAIVHIFTLDDDFRVYRLGRNRPMTIAP